MDQILLDAQKKVFAAQKSPVSMKDFMETIAYLLHSAETYMEFQMVVPLAFQRLTVNYLFFVINNAENLMDVYNPPKYNYAVEWRKVSQLLQFVDDDVFLTEETINSAFFFKVKRFLQSQDKILKIKEKVRWIWRRKSKISIKKVKEVYNRTFRPTRYGRLFLLNLKYNKFLDTNSEFKGKELFQDVSLCYGNFELYRASSLITRIDRIVSEGGDLVIEGYTLIPAGINTDTFKHFAVINGSDCLVEEVNRCAENYCFDRALTKQMGFKLSIPFADIGETLRIKVGKMIGGNRVVNSVLQYSGLCPVRTGLRCNSWFSNHCLLKSYRNFISVSPCSESEWEKNEEIRIQSCLSMTYCGITTNLMLLSKCSFGLFKWILQEFKFYEKVKNRIEAILIRAFHQVFLHHFKDDDVEYFKELLRQMRNWFDAEEITQVELLFHQYLEQSRDGNRHQIWLLIDRPERAGDNAEALFRYLVKIRPKDVDIYFLLRKDAPEYPLLAEIGNVVAPLTIVHRMLHSVADFVISSQFSLFVINPFNKGLAYLYDYRCNPHFVFLQHGVIHNHHTKAMSRYQRNFYGFVTSAKKEYDYIASPFYQYSSKEVWLTGLPRFDRLYHDEKKVITIMPTWRSWLTVHLFDEKLKTKVWSVNPDFTESDYFKFYHGLINHPRLIEAAQECGYQICFLPHVNFFSCAKLFTHPDNIHVFAEEVSYRKIFAESNLIITDYSSAIFDFAYLHKPVIYCQFDKDEFYANHTVKKGYFDFEKDGFGPVTYNLEDCVEQIIKYIRNDCRIETQYETRINQFFAFNDQNCCERVYKHIIGL